jgi:hypothetical protein
MNWPENLIAIVVFYNKSQGPSQRLAFSTEFRHCNCITFDGDDWIMTEFLPSGLLTRRIGCPDGARLVDRLRIIPEATAIVSLSIDPRARVKWFPWWARSCNEVVRYMTGVDTGFTFNPVSLYQKLIKFDGKRNFHILSHWRRSIEEKQNLSDRRLREEVMESKDMSDALCENEKNGIV